MKRVGVALMALIASLTLFTSAKAVPCAPYRIDPRDTLHARDAAFIGEVVGYEDAEYPEEITVVEVSEVIKGELDGTIEVHDAYPCGVGWEEGQTGGFLTRYEDEWWVRNSGDQIDPDLLREVASRFPKPAESKAAVLVSGSFGEVNVMALDVGGRTVGYGYGEETGESLSMCPGDDLFIQNYYYGYAVRRIADLRVDRMISYPRRTLRNGPSATCVAKSGRAVVQTQWQEMPQIFRRTDGGWERVYRGDFSVEEVRRRRALLLNRHSLYEYNFGSGAMNLLFRDDMRILDATWSPSGKKVLGAASPPPPQSRESHLWVLGKGSPRSRVLSRRYLSCGLEWLSDHRFFMGFCGKALILDDRLKTEERFNQRTGSAIYRGYAFDVYWRDVHRVSIRHPERRKLVHRFFSEVTHDIEALPGPTKITAPPHS